jgi:hypothetical protein
LLFLRKQESKAENNGFHIKCGMTIFQIARDRQRYIFLSNVTLGGD